MSYERTVTAALSETQSKFALAEGLIHDIPKRTKGGSSVNSDNVSDLLGEARQAIIDAGGEPRAVKTLQIYRLTADWARSPAGGSSFRWIVGVSWTAHKDACEKGIKYDVFAADPMRTTQLRWDKADAADKAATVRELMADPEVKDLIDADTDNLDDYEKEFGNALTPEQEQALKRGAKEMAARDSEPPSVDEEVLKIRARIRKLAERDDPEVLAALRELADFISTEATIWETAKHF